MKPSARKSPLTAYLRNFIFGVEDSLVSTVGLISGVAIAGVEQKTILLTGVVLIFVEAISMAAGTFLSEYSAEEFEEKKEVSGDQSIKNGAVMFVSYFVSGFIPLIPYVLFETVTAFWVSIGLSLASLFALGLLGGRIAHVNLMRNATRMLLVGGLAIGVGVLVGRIFGN
jgi:VIT1/CCC1 family predicted Fe2+/Mn2+ transporter